MRFHKKKNNAIDEDGRYRTVQIKFYVTPEEKEVIQKRMALLRLHNMSTYLRKISMDGYLIATDYSCFNKLFQDVDVASRAINQIAKRVNSTEKVYVDDITEVKKKQEQIWDDIRKMAKVVFECT